MSGTQRCATSAGEGGGAGRGGDGHGMLRAVTRLLSCHDLPESPPASPMSLLSAWLREAQESGAYEDHNAMTLATATPEGAPSARIVLCKAVEEDPPALVFYTSYRSRKSRELESNPLAAAVFHWPRAGRGGRGGRQARIEGRVERVGAEASDAYFATRPLLSRVAASVSAQSDPLASRAELVGAVMKAAGSAVVSGGPARPEHWGGYRLHIAVVELWSAREGRLHDRVIWTRNGEGATQWTSQRLSA